jgi:hypothetical protein
MGREMIAPQDDRELMRISIAGAEVRQVLNRRNLTVNERLKVLAAEMARITVDAQDEWPAPAQAAVNLVSGYILAARRRAAVAKATPHGSALCWLRRHL